LNNAFAREIISSLEYLEFRLKYKKYRKISFQNTKIGSPKFHLFLLILRVLLYDLYNIALMLCIQCTGIKELHEIKHSNIIIIAINIMHRVIKYATE